MDKLKLETKNIADENFELLSKLFPNALTETIIGYDEDGKAIVDRAIDADILRQEIACTVVEGKEERYQFTWPDKKKAILNANASISETLRPCREESVDFDATKNLYIEGDNLDVLKLLQETYLGSIKMIYIDPPYNTGNDFVYDDDYSEEYEEYMDNSGQYDEVGNRLIKNMDSNGRFHTDWLNMLYPRIKIARNLLKDSGVMFISIDDHEQENLKKICDEIFGAKNFIAQLIWQQRKGGGNDSRFIAVDHEYVLIYAKSFINMELKWRIGQKEEYLKRYKEIDETGRYYWDTLVRNGLQSPIVVDIVAPDGTQMTINSQKSKETILVGLKDGTVRFTKTSNGWSLHHKVYMKSGQVLRSLLTDYGNNRSAADEISKLFGAVIFDYAKPSTLIKLLSTLCTSDNDIILDYFSGSASAAHAVMKLNSEDGGRRKFIMVQLPEEIDENSEAYKAGYHNICEIGKERIRRAGKKILEENPDAKDLDIGFRVLKLDSTNMKEVYYTPSETQQTLFDLYTDNIKPDRTPEDLLFQVMLDLGVLLSSKIEETEIAGKKVFNVADGFLIACFDNSITDEVVKEVALRKPYYAVFRDSCMADDSVATNFEQIFVSYSPETIRKVL